MDILQIIQSNPIAAIVSILFGVIGILISYNRYIVANKSHKLSKSNSENGKARFNIYLEKSFRVLLRKNKGRKIILFNIRINNQSSTKNTFKSTLEIYYHDNSETLKKVILKHEPRLHTEIPQKDLLIFEKEIRLEEKDMKNGWVIFEQTKILNEKIIEKYIIKIEDSHKNHADVQAYLIKEIIHEI